MLPTIASTTFTLTVMANAHRIATEVLAGAGAGTGPVRPMVELTAECSG